MIIVMSTLIIMIAAANITHDNVNTNLNYNGFNKYFKTGYRIAIFNIKAR